jgi:hypothetical protein
MHTAQFGMPNRFHYHIAITFTGVVRTSGKAITELRAIFLRLGTDSFNLLMCNNEKATYDYL